MNGLRNILKNMIYKKRLKRKVYSKGGINMIYTTDNITYGLNTDLWMPVELDMPCDDPGYKRERSIEVTLLLKNGELVKRAIYNNVKGYWANLEKYKTIHPGKVRAWMTYDAEIPETSFLELYTIYSEIHNISDEYICEAARVGDKSMKKFKEGKGKLTPRQMEKISQLLEMPWIDYRRAND